MAGNQTKEKIMPSLINSIITTTHTPNTEYKSEGNFSLENISKQENASKFHAPLANQTNDFLICHEFDSCKYPKPLLIISLPTPQDETPVAKAIDWVMEKFEDNSSQNEKNSTANKP